MNLCTAEAHVQRINIADVSLSGVVLIGDRGSFSPRLRALAVQRNLKHSEAGEAYFGNYDIFSRPYSIRPAGPATVYRGPGNACIEVGAIEVLSVSSSAMLQVGNGVATHADARIKHIRQFARRGQAAARMGEC